MKEPQTYTDWWNQQVLEACRQAWNRPDMTMEELRGHQAVKSPLPKTDVRTLFANDYEMEADEQGISMPQYLRENR